MPYPIIHPTRAGSNPGEWPPGRECPPLRYKRVGTTYDLYPPDSQRLQVRQLYRRAQTIFLLSFTKLINIYRCVLEYTLENLPYYCKGCTNDKHHDFHKH